MDFSQPVALAWPPLTQSLHPMSSGNIALPQSLSTRCQWMDFLVSNDFPLKIFVNLVMPVGRNFGRNLARATHYNRLKQPISSTNCTYILPNTS